MLNINILRVLITITPTFFGGIVAYASSNDVSFCSDKTPPKQANQKGQTKAIIAFCPTIKDISIGSDSTHKLYSGQWYMRSSPDMSHYSQTSEGLNITLGGSLSTVNVHSQPGSLPLISGANGFYIEFIAKIDNNSNDHWPALWLNPVEHNANENDRYVSFGQNYQHWMELDVDEGGFQDGMFGTVIEWYGNHPNYHKRQNTHPKQSLIIDRTQFHTFSAFYDPKMNSVTWWLDNNFYNKSSAPMIGSKLNYYIIMSAQSHGRNIPYKLTVKRVRVFTSE